VEKTRECPMQIGMMMKYYWFHFHNLSEKIKFGN
jgi:hypothetical protein